MSPSLWLALKVVVEAVASAVLDHFSRTSGSSQGSDTHNKP